MPTLDNYKPRWLHIKPDVPGRPNELTEQASATGGTVIKPPLDCQTPVSMSATGRSTGNFVI